MMDQVNKKLSKIYYDLRSPAGFSSQKKLANVSGIDILEVKNWLSAQDAYTQHKPITRKFKRNRYHTNNMGICFEADLADMQNLSSENDGVKYILCVIDIFSKKVWAETLKDKRSASVAFALNKIFAKSGMPVRFRSDRGREFIGLPVRKLLEKNKILQIVTDNEETKCSIIERFLRTLKERLHKFFTHFGKQKYVHVLQDVINSYNNSLHSAIGCRPNDVGSHNIQQVYEFLFSGKGRYKKLETSSNKSKFKVGDTVKVSNSKHKLQKGYHANWSYEVFKITKVILREPVVYKLADSVGEELTGVWYESELQKVTVADDQAFRIEKILGSEGRGSNKRLLVKWMGYPKKFNSYISESDLINYG
jgi:hypothetical protein